MNHCAFKDQLDAYFDGELPSAEALKVVEHLKACGECQRETSDWLKIKRAFLKPEKSGLPDHFVLGVMERIAPKPSFELASFLRWCLSTFALTSVAVTFILLAPLQETAAFETALLKSGNPFVIEEVVDGIENDWTGLEAL